MRRLEASPVEGFNETTLDMPARFEVVTHDGRSLDYEAVVGNTPAITSSYDVLTSPQMVLSTASDAGTWDREKHYDVGRLQKFHGRNLEVLADSVNIEDQHGNEFFSLCIKGSDFTDPHFFESVTASRDYIIHGLQESLVMERVLRASKILRENRIDTEYICGLVVPETFPERDNDQGIDSVEQKTLPVFLESLATKFAQQNQNGKSPLEIKAEMMERFKDCDYLVTYRAMGYPWRMGELNNDQIFGKIRHFAKEKTSLDSEDQDFLNELDNREMFTKVIAGNAAINMARLHKIGLIHGFPHRHNITAEGAIVDLDSVRGPALGLGDETIKEEEYLDELLYVGHEFLEVYREYKDSLTKGDSQRSYTYEEFRELEVELSTILANIIANYMEERFDSTDDKKEFLKQLVIRKAKTPTDIRTNVMGDRSLMAICFATFAVWEQYFDENDKADSLENPPYVGIASVAEDFSKELARSKVANYPAKCVRFMQEERAAELTVGQKRLAGDISVLLERVTASGLIKQLEHLPPADFLNRVTASVTEDTRNEHIDVNDDGRDVTRGQFKNAIALLALVEVEKNLKKNQDTLLDYPYRIDKPYGVFHAGSKAFPIIYTELDDTLYEEYGLDPNQLVKSVTSFGDAIDIDSTFDPALHTLEFLAERKVVDEVISTGISNIDKYVSFCIKRDKNAEVVDVYAIFMLDAQGKNRSVDYADEVDDITLENLLHVLKDSKQDGLPEPLL